MSAAAIQFTAIENSMSINTNTRLDGFHPDDLVSNEARMKPFIGRARSLFDDHEEVSGEDGFVSQRDASRLVGMPFEEAAWVLHAWADGA